MLRVEVGTFYPALAHAGLAQTALYGLVGIYNNTFRIWKAGTDQYAGLALADAVLDSMARVDYESSLRFKPLQFIYRGPLATHVYNHRLIDSACHKLFFGIDVYFAAALAQLVGHSVENCGVVADMVGRINSGTHHRGDFI